MVAPLPSVALIRRELLVSLRKRRMFLFTALAVLVCTAGMWRIWPSTTRVLPGPQRTLMMDAVTGASADVMVSTVLLDIMCVVLMGGCALFLPGLGAVAISSERDRETYDLLHLSLIKPRGMAFGKLVNTLGVYALLAIALLPVIGVIFFTVGVSWSDVLVRAGLLGLMALATASVALYCSARFLHTAAAVAMAYVGMLFVFGIPHWFALTFFVQFPGIRQSLPFRPDFFQILLIPLSVLQVEIPIRVAFIQRVGGAVYLSLFAMFFFWRTLCVLRRPPKVRDVRQEKPIDDMASLRARRRRFPYYLIDPLRRKKPIEDGRNPVLVRELRWGVLGRITVMVRVFYVAVFVEMVAAVLFLVTNAHADADGTQGAATGMVALIACTCLAAPVLLSNLFAKEREQGNLEMLRMTLVRPREILAGKLSAALMQLAPLLAAALLVSFMLVGVFALVWGEVDCMLLAVAGLLTLGVCAWVVAAASLTVSLLARRAATALVGSYALSLVLLVGLSMLPRAASFGRFRGNYSAESIYFFRLRTSSLSPVLSYLELAGRSWKSAPAYWVGSCLGFTLVGVLLLAFCRCLFCHRRVLERGEP